MLEKRIIKIKHSGENKTQVNIIDPTLAGKWYRSRFLKE